VDVDADTDTKVSGDSGTGPDAGGPAKSRRKTRAAVAKQSATTIAATVSTVKAAEKKKKRKRKTSPPPAVETPVILMPQSREVESEEEEDDDEATEEPPIVQGRPVKRSLSPAAKRQRELVEKTTEDALRQGMEAQRAATTAQAKMSVLNRPRYFRPKPRVPDVTR
jgi:delta 1-pyrroline-5-carboxylate dehydrogenase